MHRPFSAIVSLIAAWSSFASAHNEATHRDATAYAFEIMASASAPEVGDRFAGDAEMTRFLAEASAAARTLEGLPADLPAPHRDRCVDIEVLKRFVTFSPITAAATAGTMGDFPVPADLEYIKGEKSCGVDPYWHAGTLYRHLNSGKDNHAGNLLGFWAAFPDQQNNDIAMEARFTNAAGLSEIKEIVEVAAGVGAGTAWVTLKCLADCAKGLLSLDFDECRQCVSDAYDQGSDAVHDGIATLDGLAPGIPLGDISMLQDAISGMFHHIDIKGDVLAPGWSTINKPHYDDISGLYGLTPGPYGIPGEMETAVLGLTELLGISVDYEHSDGTRHYEILDGRDFHMNTIHRRRQDWEYLNWPRVPMEPLDNLAKYGWDQFRESVAQHRLDAAKPIRTRYLGWVLHGLGDSTVPMHVTGTFGWGHRPYEDAETLIGRKLLGEMSEEYGVAADEAAALLRAALTYRKEILAWRAQHPELGKDVPVRDLVTRLAATTLSAAVAHPTVYNDTLSTAWNNPVITRGVAISAYTVEEPFMRDRLDDTVAMTIAFLTSAMEDVP